MRLWKDLGYSSRSIGAFRGKAKAAGVMALAIAGVVAMPTRPASAATFTWNGGGTGGTASDWSNTGNWGGTAPTSNTATALIFAGTKNLGTNTIPLDNNIANDFIFTTLTFSSGGGAFFLGGDSFDIEANPTITQSSASNESIANAFTNNGSNTGATLNLTGTGAGVVTLSGAISNGTGLRTVAVTETGSSTYILSDGSNSFSGGVNVDGGTLEITAAGAMGTGTATINGGTLQLAGITSTKALTFDAGSALEGSGTTVQNAAVILANTASGAFTLETSSTASDSFTIDSGDLSGGASTSTITVQGAGTITLGGANTYAGLWNLSSGTLSIGADTDLGAAPTSPGVANYLTFSGGTLDATASFALSQYRGIQLGTAGGTFDVASTKTLTYGGTIANVSGQTGGLTLATGTGTLLLTTANTYSGNTTVSAGTLAVQNSASLGTGAVVLNGGNLDLQTGGALTAYNTTVSASSTLTSDLAGSGAGVNYTLGTLSIGAQTLSLAKGANVASGTAAATFGTTTLTGNATFSPATGTALTLGALADGGTGRTITFSGSGATTLGTAASSLVSGTAVTMSSTLNLNTTGALGTGTAAVTNNTGGTLVLGANQSLLSLTGAARSTSAETR